MLKLLRAALIIIALLAILSPSFAVTSISDLTEEAVPVRGGAIITMGYLVQLLFSLLIVFGLIYLTAKYVLPKLNIASRGKMIEVLDRVGLEPGVAAYVIKAGGRSFLVAASNKNVQLLSEIDESAGA